MISAIAIMFFLLSLLFCVFVHCEAKRDHVLERWFFHYFNDHPPGDRLDRLEFLIDRTENLVCSEYGNVRVELTVLARRLVIRDAGKRVWDFDWRRSDCGKHEIRLRTTWITDVNGLEYDIKRCPDDHFLPWGHRERWEEIFNRKWHSSSKEIRSLISSTVTEIESTILNESWGNAFIDVRRMKQNEHKRACRTHANPGIPQKTKTEKVDQHSKAVGI